MMSEEIVVQIVLMVATGGGVYGAIRSDIAALHVKVGEALKSAERAHQRIDEHIEICPRNSKGLLS